MKVVFLNGSARSEGNTSFLLKRLRDSIVSDQVETELIHLSEKRIQYCLGCHTCEKTRSCIQKDDMNEIYKNLIEADLIFIASPSYWGDITGQLKIFIDRSTPYCNTNTGGTTFPKSKKVISLAIRAGSGKEENEKVLSSIKHYCSHLEMKHLFDMSFESIRSMEDFKKHENKIVLLSEMIKEWLKL